MKQFLAEELKVKCNEINSEEEASEKLDPDEILKNICEKELPIKYEEISSELRSRLDFELNAIKNSESASMFIQIKDAVDRLGLMPYEMGLRGTAASSLVAYLCGISEIDPIKANLSPYFFFGYKGEKELSIDLNIRSGMPGAADKAFADTQKVVTVMHDSPEIIKRLCDLTGADPGEIRLDDPDVMGMFQIKGDRLPGCAGIPEFRSVSVINALKVADCHSFDDLVKLFGLMHGTGVWDENAKALIKEGRAGISDVLADGDDVYEALLSYGLDEELAFAIAQEVRMGRVGRGKSRRWEEWKAALLEHGVPGWFISSCEKTGYMFPRAHSYSYTLFSWRMAWYKLHYPLAYYKVMQEVCA